MHWMSKHTRSFSAEPASSKASQPWTRVYGYMHKMYEVLLDTAMAQYEYKEQAVYQTCEKVFQVVPKHQATSKNFTMTQR